MNEKTVIITEKDDAYHIQNNGISEFALLGILECIVFEMKTASHKESDAKQEKPATDKQEISQEQKQPQEQKPNETIEESKKTEPEIKKEATPEPSASDLRTRISNAVKAIRELGGKIENTDLSEMTEEELQAELAELTDQYKRLKSSRAKK